MGTQRIMNHIHRHKSQLLPQITEYGRTIGHSKTLNLHRLTYVTTHARLQTLTNTFDTHTTPPPHHPLCEKATTLTVTST